MFETGIARYYTHRTAYLVSVTNTQQASEFVFVSRTTVFFCHLRNDLIAAEPSGASAFGASKQRQRRRVFVALGSAIRGLSQYLLLGETETMALRQQQERTTHGLQQQQHQQYSGIVCVDPPPHLWNNFGRSMLHQTCRGKIPLLVVGYEDDNGNDNKLNSSNSNSNGRGDLLRDFRSHPQAMVVIARASARVGEHRGNNDNDSGNNNNNVASTNGENRADACFWLARLITVYVESLQRLKTPPGKSMHPIARSNNDYGLPAMSKL